MDSEVKSLMKVCFSAFASLCYCYYIVTKIPKGKVRVMSLIPIICYFTILPLTLTSPSLKGTSAFFFTWLANFKLLLFSFDQGPLSSASQVQSLQSFIAIACLPVKIKQKKPSKDKFKQDPCLQSLKPPTKTSHVVHPKKSHLGLVIKFSLLVLVVHLYCTTTPHFIFSQILLLSYVYLSLEILLATGATLARAVLSLELEPQSDEPYLATSLQDFWGRRWNLMISNILRPTVYHLARHIFTRIFGRRGAQLVAVLITFIVSGLMHELIFFYISNVHPTWEVTWFFILHGVSTAMEIGVKRSVTEKWQLHCAVSRLLTVGYVVVTSMWLFLPPALEGGSDLGIKESGAVVEFIIGKIVSI